MGAKIFIPQAISSSSSIVVKPRVYPRLRISCSYQVGLTPSCARVASSIIRSVSSALSWRQIQATVESFGSACRLRHRSQEERFGSPIPANCSYVFRESIRTFSRCRASARLAFPVLLAAIAASPTMTPVIHLDGRRKA